MVSIQPDLPNSNNHHGALFNLFSHQPAQINSVRPYLPWLLAFHQPAQMKNSGLPTGIYSTCSLFNLLVPIGEIHVEIPVLYAGIAGLFLGYSPSALVYLSGIFPGLLSGYSFWLLYYGIYAVDKGVDATLYLIMDRSTHNPARNRQFIIVGRFPQLDEWIPYSW